MKEKLWKESEETIKMKEGKTTVTLGDLLSYIFLRWRLLLVYMIIFAVLAGAYACLKSYREVVAFNDTQQSESDYSQYESGLTDREIQEVKNVADEYLVYEEAYTNYKKYESESLRMQLDPNAVPTKELIYRISGNGELVNVRNAYAEIIPNDAICKKILQETNWNIEKAYVKELITVTNPHMDSIVVEGNEIQLDNGNNASEMISISIISDSEENCETISNVVDQELNTITAELQDQFGEFTIQKISENYGEETNNDLLDDKEAYAVKMNNISTVMRNLEDSLSDAQQEYFFALLDESLTELNDENVDSIVEEESEANAPQMQYVNVKYIIVGAAGGAFLFLLYMLCRFLLNKHFISKYYITDDLNCPVLGVFSGKNQKKKFGNVIDRWIIKVFNKENDTFSEDKRLEMLCAGIKVMAQKGKIQKIYVTSSVDSKEVNELIQKLKEALPNNEVVFETGNSILYDAESLEKFVLTDGVIFIEQIGKSLLDEMYQETECCDKYGINNLGFVVVD